MSMNDALQGPRKVVDIGTRFLGLLVVHHLQERGLVPRRHEVGARHFKQRWRKSIHLLNIKKFLSHD